MDPDLAGGQELLGAVGRGGRLDQVGQEVLALLELRRQPDLPSHQGLSRVEGKEDQGLLEDQGQGLRFFVQGETGLPSCKMSGRNMLHAYGYNLDWRGWGTSKYCFTPNSQFH